MVYRLLLTLLIGFEPLVKADIGDTYFCTPISSHAIDPVEGSRERSPDHEKFIFLRKIDGTLEFKPKEMNNLYATKVVKVSEENEERFWANATDKTLGYADGLLSATYLVNEPLERKPVPGSLFNTPSAVIWVDYAKCQTFEKMN